MSKIDVAGLKIDSVSKREFLDAALRRIQNNQKTFVITPYSEFLYNSFQEPKLLEIFNAADFSLADGIGIFWAKKYLEIPLTAKSYWGKICQAAWQMFYSLSAIIFYPRFVKSALPEKIVGADLVWDLAKMAADNHLSVFLLGGYDDTPKKVAKKFTIYDSRFKTAGYSNKNPNDPSVIADINNAHPDILLVAYGPMKQEKWIMENLPQLNTKLAIGVGGTFDYIAGTKTVPPKFIRYAGLEWLWRLFTQPTRIKRIWNATFGLMSCLWHYKVFNDLPLRKNAAIVIINEKAQILACQRSFKKPEVISTNHLSETEKYWQLPQGGIDENENLTEAARREAKEEVGLTKLSFLTISDKTHTYNWNNALRKSFSTRRRNKGQTQNIVYFKFTGQDEEIKIDGDEFVGWQWIDIAKLPNTIHAERHGLTKIVMEDLNEMLEKGIIKQV